MLDPIKIANEYENLLGISKTLCRGVHLSSVSCLALVIAFSVILTFVAIGIIIFVFPHADPRCILYDDE